MDINRLACHQLIERVYLNDALEVASLDFVHPISPLELRDVLNLVKHGVNAPGFIYEDRTDVGASTTLRDHAYDWTLRGNQNELHKLLIRYFAAGGLDDVEALIHTYKTGVTKHE